MHMKTNASMIETGCAYVKSSRPKASNGQQFPYPAQLAYALSSSFVFVEGSRAAAPIGDKVL